MPRPSDRTAWDFMPEDWRKQGDRWLPPAGFEPSTQLEFARLGVVTPEMERVAEKEPHLSAEQIRDEVAAGDTVIFHNGVVLPVDAGFSQHAALAIRGNRVLAVGDIGTVRRAAGAGAREVDLDGRTVLPGFIEPHMHFALLAGLGHLPDIGPFQRPTFDDALDAIAEIRAVATGVGPDEWVMGRQFDPILLEPPRDLTTSDLDPIVPAPRGTDAVSESWWLTLSIGTPRIELAIIEKAVS